MTLVFDSFKGSTAGGMRVWLGCMDAASDEQLLLDNHITCRWSAACALA